MNRFLVQVSKDIGYANIMNNKRYQNYLWKEKPRDADHGEVNPGDELVIYCTGNVPRHGKSLAFSVAVSVVSADHITFELGEPQWFPKPLGLEYIRNLVSEKTLPEEFRKQCGQQGFNIAKIDNTAAERLMNVVGLSLDTGSSPEFELSPITTDGPKSVRTYTVDDILDNGCFLDRATLETMLQRLKTKQSIILQGPPGAGKTWLSKKLAYALIGRKDDDQVRQVQFHPNLSYEDFVRGWRPHGDGKLQLVDGPFLEMSKIACQNPDRVYVMVIEEINRGNPASIFGELLTLLEADKRNQENALALAYPREGNERFHIPPNVYVIGTMNLADRSLALVDFALRRRFAFFDLEPIFNDTWHNWVQQRITNSEDFPDTIKQRIVSLNQQIASDPNLGPQFRIGHSHFTPTPDAMIDNPERWFKDVVETEIAPLLREYWFDNADRAEEETVKLLSGL